MRSPVVANLLALLSAREPDPRPPALDAAGWAALTHEAVRHGVAPLVHARLEAAGAAWTAPEEARRILQAAHLRTGLENLRLLTRLATVLRQCQVHGIAVIVLKGAHLATSVYPDSSLRSMGDADLLVRRADLERANALLRAGGWRDAVPHGPPAAPGGHQLPALALGGAHLELHWAIEDDDSPFAIDADGLWHRTMRMDLGGAMARVLSPEDLLLHLALHAAYGHGWLQFDNGLRPLCDVVACLHHFDGEFDWAAAVERARAWRIHPSVWLTLTLAQRLLHAPVPPCALAALAPAHTDESLVETAEALLLGSHYRDLAAHLPTLGRAWLTKRWHRLSRARHWRAHALPRRESLASAYPRLSASALQPLRYAAHWGDLLNDVARLSFGPRGRQLLAQERSRRTLLWWLEGQESPPARSP